MTLDCQNTFQKLSGSILVTFTDLSGTALLSQSSLRFLQTSSFFKRFSPMYFEFFYFVGHAVILTGT